jgi:hypothetical protein
MSIVNVKVEFIRKSGFNNLKEWMNHTNNIYIGRAGVVFVDKRRFPEQSSPFANPFKIGKDGTRDEVIAKYKEYMVNKLNGDPELVKKLVALRGKNLGCWCAPEPCHGNVLLELIPQFDTRPY